LLFPTRRCPDKEQFDCFDFVLSFVNPNFLETIPMKYDLTEKKAWITPGIEEAPVQATEARQWTTWSEWTGPITGKTRGIGGAEPDGSDQPGGPS
jgi:hypothetical protein